jgi:serine protease Do
VRLAYALTIGALLAGSAVSVAQTQGDAARTRAAPASTPDTQTDRGPQNAPGRMNIAPPNGAPMSFADTVAQLQPAVVNVSTTQRVEVGRTGSPFGGGGGTGNPLEEFFKRFQNPQQQGDDGQPVTRRATSLGSGFIISADGYIVTNNHVVTGRNQNDPVDTITVKLNDGREFPAKLIGRDPAVDVAVLKINATGLPYVRFGDRDRVRVGDWVLAIGNPFNLGGTVTAGIVSALHRDIGGQFGTYIQTDASINQGNSGGPLFDLQGNVVGINTIILSPTGGNIGLGFSIPADVAKPVIDQLRATGRVRRGYAGVQIQPLNENIAAGLGLPKNSGEIVASVEPNGPAARAGVRQGDVIVGVGGEKVTEDNRLSPLIAKQRIGATVPLDIIRNGRRVTVNLVVAERPNEQQIASTLGGDDDQPAPQKQEEGQQAAKASLGITLQALTPELRSQLRLSNDVQGVVIAAVNQSSDAAEKGLSRGMVIRSINQQPVTTPQQAASIVEQARKSGRKTVLMLVQQGNGPAQFVGVDLVSADSKG